jgi:hypothetical protein
MALPAAAIPYHDVQIRVGGQTGGGGLGPQYQKNVDKMYESGVYERKHIYHPGWVSYTDFAKTRVKRSECTESSSNDFLDDNLMRHIKPNETVRYHYG